MLQYVTIFRLIIFFIVVFISAACGISSTAQDVSDYDKLCNIYEDIVNNPSSQTKIFMLLTEKIKKEIPDIYVFYKNAALVDRKDKYKFYKAAAVKATAKQWDCAAMKAHFSNTN